MSDHNGAPQPAPHPINGHLHPDDRFPGVNHPYKPAPAPYNADAEHTSDPDQLRENPGFWQRAGSIALQFGRHVRHAVGHQAHAIGHDLHETLHESTQGLIGDPSTTRGAQKHLREQQLAQLEGRHPHVANTPFASHQRHAVGKTLHARLDRVDKLAQKVGIIVETIAPAEAVLETWPESWQSFIDPRNIIRLRDTYLGMPMGNIKNLLPSQRADMENMLLPIHAGGFKRLPEALQRAYLGMSRDAAAHPEGPHDEEGAHFLAMIDYVDRALRISVSAPSEFRELARQITDRPIEADQGIADRIGVYESRRANGVYDYPEPWIYNPRSDNQEEQLSARLKALDHYLGNFYGIVRDPNDRDWDLAEPYRQEYFNVKDQLAKVRSGKKPRQS